MPIARKFVFRPPLSKRLSVGEGRGCNFAITKIDLQGTVVTLTWISGENIPYKVFASTDLVNWGTELDDNVPGDPGDSTTRPFDLSDYQLEAEEQLFFRVERGG